MLFETWLKIQHSKLNVAYDSELAASNGSFQQTNKLMEQLRVAEASPLGIVHKDLFELYGEENVVEVMKKATDQVIGAEMQKMQTDERFFTPAEVAQSLVRIYQVPSELSNVKIQDHAKNGMSQIIQYSMKRAQLDKERATTDAERSRLFDFNALGAQLQGQGRGGEIVSDTVAFPEFQAFKIAARKAKMTKVSDQRQLDTLADDNDLNPTQKGHLCTCLKAANVEFRQLVDHAWDHDLRKLAGTVRDTYRSERSVPKLIGGICAVWAIASCPEGSNEMNEPHSVQLLAMFMLLGAEKGGPSWFVKMGSALGVWSINSLNASHLIQVGTGEGKSVLLGVLSTFLAVMGCEVDCVSYQEYLSRRDYASFVQVFDAFQVSSAITYGTFQELAERSIDANGPLPRKLASALVDQTEIPEPVGAADPPNRILLIDEVDVFFSPDFYGATYNPSAKRRRGDGHGSCCCGGGGCSCAAAVVGAEGVAEWLSSTLNLPGVADAVLAKGVDGETAAAMDKADWAELGASGIESAKIWAKLQSLP